MLSKAQKIFRGMETPLIFLLLISAVYLLLRATVIDTSDYIEELFSGGADQPASSSVSSTGIVPSYPFAIVLTGDDGSHSAVKYNKEAKQRVFSLFSATLGEALGSAGEAETIKESDWTSALEGHGVFFDYLYPLPLEILSTHLGAAMPSHADGNLIIRRLILSEREEKLCLYLKDEAQNAYYRMDTPLNFSSLNLSQRITDLALPEADFAFQRKAAGIDPCFVFSGEDISLPELSSSPISTGSDGSTLSLSTFRMNAGAASVYSENDGTQIYVEGGKSLRVDSSGYLLFAVTGTGGIPVGDSETATLSDRVYAAGVLVRNTLPTGGDVDVGLLSVEDTESDGCTIYFGYYVNGIPVKLQNTDWCAKVRISGENIVRAEFYLRSYAVQTTFLAPLPENHAAILAAEEGGEPLLVYTDRAEDVTWSWILN